MHLICFSVHDSKANAFIQPFFAPTQAVGRRMFTQAATDPDSDICRFPADYTLFELGTFNSQSGMTTFHDSPVSLGLAVTFKSQPLLAEVATIQEDLS